jgi:hypothetical protein
MSAETAALLPNSSRYTLIEKYDVTDAVVV